MFILECLCFLRPYQATQLFWNRHPRSATKLPARWSSNMVSQPAKTSGSRSIFRSYEGQIRAGTPASTPGGTPGSEIPAASTPRRTPGRTPASTPGRALASTGIPSLQALQCLVFVDRSSYPIYAGRYMQQTVLQTLRQGVFVKKPAPSTSTRGLPKADI